MSTKVNADLAEFEWEEELLKNFYGRPICLFCIHKVQEFRVSNDRFESVETTMAATLRGSNNEAGLTSFGISMIFPREMTGSASKKICSQGICDGYKIAGKCQFIRKRCAP